MWGKIISDTDGQIEVLVRHGEVRTFWKRPGGFYLGENGRLYTTRTVGDHGHQRLRDKEIEFISLGVAASADIERYHVERESRTVKESLARDHLLYLSNDQKMSLRAIARMYGTSPQYISKLVRELQVLIPERRKDNGIRQMGV